MKTIYSFFTAFLLSVLAFGQAPQKMSYQAVLRNNSHALIINTTVGMRISILQSGSTGTAVYVETHNPTTNANGLVTLEIGNGTIVNGTFASIDWANGPYFIKTETDPAGGTSYSITGTSELLSVPYALFSKTAETVTTITETDPAFSNSPAATITTQDLTNLSNLSGTNTGDQDGSETIVTGGANTTVTGTGTATDPYVVNAPNQLPDGTAEGEMLYWNGTSWIIVETGNDGDHMVFCNGRPVWGGCNLLTVTKAGTGNGTVTSSVSGINCGTDCQQYYASNTTVTLTATSDATSTFTGWAGGGCAGTGSCVVTMDNAKSVTATFSSIQYTLTVAKTGTGNGTVTSSPGGINCGPTCNTSYDVNTVVTLTAASNSTSTFTGWSGGGCTGTGTCVVTMNSAKTVTANFTLNQYNLTVSRSGSGNGGVTSDVGTINCGATCINSYNAGTLVTLTATPNSTSTFTGWTGACTGTGVCTVTMNNAQSVNATFSTIQYNLNVSRTGTGMGTVTSNVGTINCGATCTNAYNINTVVTLTAAANASSTFTGWSGACSGTGACVVTLDNVKTVNANFDATPTQYNLAITKSGTGNGGVTSDVGSINCGVTCSEAYNSGTTVTLTATPNSTSTFTGWSGGACTGTGTCVVLMNSAKTVGATFSVNQYNLNVSKTGAGGGTVTSNTGAINCGPTCSDTYNHSTSVTLTATANSTSTFTGWSGACTGTGACLVTMDQAKSVTANFDKLQYNLTILRTGTGMGSVTSDVGGINCGITCNAVYNVGSMVVLTANPSVGSSFTGWSGPCTGTGACVVTMDAAKSVTATFDNP